MKRIMSALSVTAAMLIASTHIAAQAADPYTDGWVVRVDGANLEICFKHAESPAVGQLVQLLRTHYETPNKGSIRQTLTPDGHARIVSVATPPCVMATLLDGKVQRSDHARPQDRPSSQLH